MLAELQNEKMTRRDFLYRGAKALAASLLLTVSSKDCQGPLPSPDLKCDLMPGVVNFGIAPHTNWWDGELSRTTVEVDGQAKNAIEVGGDFFIPKEYNGKEITGVRITPAKRNNTTFGGWFIGGVDLVAKDSTTEVLVDRVFTGVSCDDSTLVSENFILTDLLAIPMGARLDGFTAYLLSSGTTGVRTKFWTRSGESSLEAFVNYGPFNLTLNR